jgi:flavin reductase (DIM6/NTAB) family NADH-FMN oxidoreductase RutF
MPAREESEPGTAASALQDNFKQACAMFPSGVTVITVRSGDLVHGITASAFSSVSLRPPQVLVCVDRGSKLHDMVVASGAFAVSVLAREQAALSDYFATPGREPVASFAEIGHPQAAECTGAPILAGCAAFFDCTLAQAYDGGDHTIFVGTVEAAGTDPAKIPLLFFARGYRSFG